MLKPSFSFKQAIGTYWDMENQFSSMESQSLYQNHTPGEAVFPGVVSQHKIHTSLLDM